MLAKYKEELAKTSKGELKTHGWINHSIFLRSDGLLVAYVEASDWEKSKTADVPQWKGALTTHLQSFESITASATELEQVFFL